MQCQISVHYTDIIVYYFEVNFNSFFEIFA